MTLDTTKGEPHMAYEGGSCITLYGRVARWELRGLKLKGQLESHRATCTCPGPRCGLCRLLIELASEEKPRFERLFMHSIRARVRAEDEISG